MHGRLKLNRWGQVPPSTAATLGWGPRVAAGGVWVPHNPNGDPNGGVSGGRGHFTVGALIEIVTNAPNANASVVGAGKDVTVVSGNCVNG